MKFKAKIEGLVQGLNPIITAATKEIQKDYPQANLITLTATDTSLQAVSDSGRMSAFNEINDIMYGLDYVVTSKGEATVNAPDLHKVLSSFSINDIVQIELQDRKGNDGSSMGKELLILLESDKEQFQTLPVRDTPCQFIAADMTKNSTNITLRRDVFSEYAGKIIFAHGFQQQYKSFTYWVLRSFDSGSLRFAAGTGTRFAVAELAGTNAVAKAKVVASITFPNDQTQSIITVLGNLRGDNVSIQSHDKYLEVSCDNLKMLIYNCDPTVNWPNEELFLNRDSKFKFITKVGNWRNALKGIVATYNEESKKTNQVHNCVLSFDIPKKLIQARSEQSLRSNRKVSIDNIATNEDKTEIVINCNTNYINDVISKSSDDDNIQIEIEDESKPIIVRHYAANQVQDPLTLKKPSDNGIQELYAEFFAPIGKN